MDALPQALHDLHDLPAGAAGEMRQEFVLKECQDRSTAGSDRVAEAPTMLTRAIRDVDDWQLEGVEFLNGVTARRVQRQPDQSRVSSDNGGRLAHGTASTLVAFQVLHLVAKQRERDASSVWLSFGERLGHVKRLFRLDARGHWRFE